MNKGGRQKEREKKKGRHKDLSRIQVSSVPVKGYKISPVIACFEGAARNAVKCDYQWRFVAAPGFRAVCAVKKKKTYDKIRP